MGRKKKQTFGWHRDDPEPDNGNRASRSDRKRIEDERKLLVKALLAVGPERLKSLPISDDLREALVETHRLQASHARSGLRRQVLRVSGLLREAEDEQEISDALGIKPGASGA